MIIGVLPAASRVNGRIVEDMVRYGEVDFMSYMQNGNVLAFIIGACGLAVTIFYRKRIARWLRVIMLTFCYALMAFSALLMILGAGYVEAEALIIIFMVIVGIPLMTLLAIVCVVYWITKLINSGNLCESFRSLGRMFMQGYVIVPATVIIGVSGIFLIEELVYDWGIRECERYIQINDNPDKGFRQLIHEWEDAHILQWGRPEDHTPIEVAYPVTE